MEHSGGEDSDIRPQRRTTGSFGPQPPQRRKTDPRRYEALRGNVRYIPPPNAVPGRAEPYPQASEETYFQASPVAYPPVAAQYTSVQQPGYVLYESGPYGTHPAPAQIVPIRPEYSPYLSPGTRIPHYREYREEADEHDYRHQVPYQHRQARGYARRRSPSHGSTRSSRWQRYTRSRSSDSDSRLDGKVIHLDVEDDYDDSPEAKVFSFVPMRAEKPSPEVEALSSNLEVVEFMQIQSSPPGARLGQLKSGPTDDKNALIFPAANRILHVIESRYTGDAYFDGTHSANLTVAHDVRRSRQPLFRWLHIQQKQLNLDELSAEIAGVSNLSSEELHGITRLLSLVRNNVKQNRTANGKSVKHMQPGTIRINIEEDRRSRSQGYEGRAKKRSLTWSCIPFLVVEQYSGLMSTSTSASFPPETLLQHDYAATAQARDMDQVVVRAQVARDGECIHVDQLWSIVLDKSLLITCGRMSSSKLRNDVIKIVTEPPLETTSKAKAIYVSYSHSKLWAFPLNECRTWFTFVKHFSDFWPEAIRLYYRDRIVTEKDWPRIVSLASNITVTVELRLSPPPQLPATGVLQPLHADETFVGESEAEAGGTTTQQGSKRNSAGVLPESVNSEFHVFTWMDIARPQGVKSAALNYNKIIEQLTQAEDYLSTSTTWAQRKAYKACRDSTAQKVHAYLEKRGKDFDNVAEGDDERRNGWAAGVDLYNAAEIVFSFFLPKRLSGDAPTVRKFWGAIESIIELLCEDGTDRRYAGRRGTSATRGDSWSTNNLSSTIRKLARTVQSFQGNLSNTTTADRTTIEVSDGLVCAWLHLVIGLVQNSQDPTDFSEDLETADQLIRNGMGDIMEGLSAEDLLNNAIVQPVELVSLLSLKLIEESVMTELSLSDTYSQYIKHLDNTVTENPNRSHQARISQVVKEIDIIRRVMMDQKKVVAGMVPPKPSRDVAGQTRQEARIMEKTRNEFDREKTERTAWLASSKTYPAMHHRTEDTWWAHNLSSSNRDPDDFAKLSPLDPGGFAEFFVGECMSLLERRDNEFAGFLLETSRIENYNATNIEITKDNQEKAVYAFTMVTIIFLPLGTISSIFGMNTSDIANMEMGQWIYWVTALPITFGVILGGLWWMGELQNLMRWLVRMPRKGRGSTGYGMTMMAMPQGGFAQPGQYYATAPHYSPEDTAIRTVVRRRT